MQHLIRRSLIATLPLLTLVPLAHADDASLIPPEPAPRVPQTDMGIPQQPNSKLQWMLDDKIGMFIHWGLYSGVGQGEWYQENHGIPPDQYRKLAFPEAGDQYFDASDYHPDQWAQLAKDAGMKWMCLTTRHHDGFALFDLPFPNAFDSMQTLHRDLVAEYVKACRAAGLKVGLYFSPIDWRYPGYYDPTGTHCYPNKFGYKTDPAHKENARIMKEENYVAVKTLMTKYGHIDEIFWDGGWMSQRGTDRDGAFFNEPGKFLDPNNPWPIDKQYQDFDPATGKPLGIMGMVRKYQPDAICNLRYGWMGDIIEEEGSGPTKGPIRSSTICDKCLTMQFGPWGYSKEANEKGHIMSRDDLIGYLANCVIRNMVLMVNVSPDRHGVIPQIQQDHLRQLGQWLDKTGDAIYKTRGGPWNPVDGQYGYTFKDNKIFIHLLPGYKGSDFQMPPVGTWPVDKVYDVYSNQPLPFTGGSGHPIDIHNINRTESKPDTILAIQFPHDIESIWKK